MMSNGTQRNWTVIGLSPENTVLVNLDGTCGLPAEQGRDTGEKPSTYIDIDYLTRAERAILRRGLTPAGRDRERPR